MVFLGERGRWGPLIDEKAKIRGRKGKKEEKEGKKKRGRKGKII
jgi:hypothetical protein